MGVGTTWIGELSSDRPGVEKGPRSGPMEHVGSLGPLPTEPEDLSRAGLALPPAWGQGEVEAVLPTQTPLTAQPPGPRGHPAFR